MTVLTTAAGTQETQAMHTTDTDSADTASSTDIPVLEMVQPMLGFPELRSFALARHDEDGAIYDLRSLEDETVRFVVVPPVLFFSDYAPEIPDAAAELLEAGTGEDLLALVVVTLGKGLSDATANLVAPVLVNHRTRRAAQVVVDDPGLSVRTPLVPDHAPEL